MKRGQLFLDYRIIGRIHANFSLSQVKHIAYRNIQNRYICLLLLLKHCSQFDSQLNSIISTTAGYLALPRTDSRSPRPYLQHGPIPTRFGKYVKQCSGLRCYYISLHISPTTRNFSLSISDSKSSGPYLTKKNVYTKGYAHVTIQVVYVSQISLPKLPEALLKSSFLGSFDLIASILEHPEEGQK